MSLKKIYNSDKSVAIHHADVFTPFKAMKAVEGMDALEIQMERDRVKKDAVDIASILTAGLRRKYIERKYDELTAKLVRNRMQSEQLKTAVRRKNENI